MNRRAFLRLLAVAGAALAVPVNAVRGLVELKPVGSLYKTWQDRGRPSYGADAANL